MAKQSKLISTIATEQFEIAELLEKLTKHNDDHFGVDPDTADWGDAGSMSKVRNDLKAIVEFLDL